MGNRATDIRSDAVVVPTVDVAVAVVVDAVGTILLDTRGCPAVGVLGVDLAVAVVIEAIVADGLAGAVRAAGGDEPGAGRVAAQGPAGVAAGDAGLPVEVRTVADLGSLDQTVTARLGRGVTAGRVEPGATAVAGQGPAGVAARDAGLAVQVAAVADLAAVQQAVAAHRAAGRVECAAGRTGQRPADVAEGGAGLAVEVDAVALLGAGGDGTVAAQHGRRAVRGAGGVILAYLTDAVAATGAACRVQLAGGRAGERAPGVTQAHASVSTEVAAVAVLTGVQHPVTADGSTTAIRGAGKFGLAGLADSIPADSGNAGAAGGAQEAAGRAGQRATCVSEGYAGPTVQVGAVANLALVGDAIATDNPLTGGVAEAGVVGAVHGAVAVVVDAVGADLRPRHFAPGGAEMASGGADQRPAPGEPEGGAGLATVGRAVAGLAGVDDAVAAVLPGLAGRVGGAFGVGAVDVAVAVVIDAVVAVLHRLAAGGIELAGRGAGERPAGEALRDAGLPGQVGAVAVLLGVDHAVAAVARLAGRVLGTVGVIAVDVAVAVVVDVVIAVLHDRVFTPGRVELARGRAGQRAARETLGFAGLAVEIGAIAGLTLVDGSVAAELSRGQSPAGARATDRREHQNQKKRTCHDDNSFAPAGAVFEFSEKYLTTFNH